MDKLNPKQLRFAQEYVIDLNATLAARRAGYSVKSAEWIGCRLTKNVKVAAEIERLQAEIANKLGITAERVLDEIAKLAFNDPRKFFDEDGRIKPVKELDDDTAMSLAGIETFHKIIGDEKDGMAVVTKVRISDKRSSLELLGRHLKLFTDKLEVNDTDALAAKLKAARTRKVKG